MADAGKIGRTVRLVPDVNARLMALCAYLGVNPNAYIVAEIGKAIARDEVSFRAKNQMQDFLDGLGDLLLQEKGSD